MEVSSFFFGGIRKEPNLTCEGLTGQRFDLRISNFSLGKEGML